MSGNLMCIAAVLLGVDVGWQPLPDGGVEYLIQIEPHVLETLKSGEPIASDIPTRVTDVRAYRITVGTEKLPREVPAPLPKTPSAAAPDFSGPAAAPPPAIQPSLGEFTTPGTLSPAPDSQPIGEPRTVLAEATEVENAVAKKVESKSPPQPAAELPEESNPPSEKEPSKPWLLTLFGLFASLGGNVYLLWIAAGFRSRYYAIAGQPERPTSSMARRQRAAEKP